jgi:hypothetical protein
MTSKKSKKEGPERMVATNCSGPTPGETDDFGNLVARPGFDPGSMPAAGSMQQASARHFPARFALTRYPI